MNLYNFDYGAFIGFIFVFVRMSGLMFTMPVLGATTIPTQARIGLVAITSYIVFSVAKLPPVDMGMPMGRLTLMLAGELAIGLTIGYASQLIFTAVQFAGQLIGFQIGFGIVNVLDPTTNSQVSITSQFWNIVALLVFLAINGHHWLITAAARSFDLIPVLGFTPHAGLVDLVTTLTADVFVLAIKLAAPVMATMLLLNVALGLIARTVPQMNVFIVGFPVQIALGLFMIGAGLPVFYMVFRGSIFNLFENVIGLMKLMA